MEDPRVLTRARLLAAGTSAFEIARELRTGELVPVAHGVYLRRGDHGALDGTGRHRVLARHFGSTLDQGEAISHISAATLHGAPVWNLPLTRVHVSRTPGAGARHRGRLHIHTARWMDADLTVVDAVPVTSVARTIADVARTVPRPQAVIIGDALLRIDPAAAAWLPRVVEAASGLHGVARARAVAGFLDARSESVGESLSRVRIEEAGLPRPVLQHEVVVRDGRRCRLDFFWDEAGVVGEFDGAGKYSDRRDLVAEKLREDALRDVGFEVIRWNWAELDRFDVVVRRFERARARRRRQ
ncbi:hypothetical protein [Rhodococcus phenolicus]|uniref:hypothetical protein n=1 Tax=Rhodococcus phenolicus TaxID=263849 RepID=UPI00082E10CD|nr:hypothetical protein [Rhodococcus phenolicus]